LVVTPCRCTPVSDETVELGHLGYTYGRLDVRKTQIEAKVVEGRHRPGPVRLERGVRLTGGAVVALRPHEPGEVFAIGRNGAALARRDHLARMEREAADVAEAANRAALVGCGNAASSVLDHGEAV